MNNSTIPDAIILAGGLGTRLKAEVPDLPKCMAFVAGRPFVDHLIGYFQDAGIKKFIFALGYLHEIVLDHLATKWPDLHYEFTIETEPLGTGGAIHLAAKKVQSSQFLVLNGDTFFSIDYRTLWNVHMEHAALITVALKYMINFERYGTVEIDTQQKIIGFREKQKSRSGLINGGIYLINKTKYDSLILPEKFSFEKDLLEKKVGTSELYGAIFSDYFIDIGIPEDFKKASLDLKFLSF